MHAGKRERGACGLGPVGRRNGQLLSELHKLAAKTQSMMTKAALDRSTAFRPRNPVERRTNSMTRYSTHITKDSNTFGSRKYAAPMCSCAIREPISRPPVMQ